MEKLRQLTTEEIIEMNSIKWWHRIPIGLDTNNKVIYTPGIVSHGPDGGTWPQTRFGVPSDLIGKSVLDVGAWDGFFSFECERAGASFVQAIDIFQNKSDDWHGTDGFNFARKILGSEVVFTEENVYNAGALGNAFDVVLCYGVLYHLKEPLRAIEALYQATKNGGTVLIETARESNQIMNNVPVWTLKNGHNGDYSNFWYPSTKGLIVAMELAGFTNCNCFYDDGNRITVSAIKE